MFQPETYRARRVALCGLLRAAGRGDALVFLPGNADSPRNYRDNTYPFRQDSTFLYFLGLPVRGLCATIDAGSGATTLYGDDAGIDSIIWTGSQTGLAELASLSSLSAADGSGIAPASSIRSDLAATRVKARPVLFLPPYRDSTRIEISGLLDIPLHDVDASASADLVRAVCALREIKDPDEIAEHESAIAISVRMHQRALVEAEAGMTEASVAAIVAGEALSSGAELAFPVIATTRGQVLHDLVHSGILREGGTFLIDAGAESARGYAGDLTTTFPVGRTFTPRQRDIYSLLLSVFKTASAGLGPGVFMRDVHMAASTRLAEGLVALGIMRGDPAEAAALGAAALFFPHGIGHMIGLDVHDMENLGEDLVGYDAESGPRSELFGLRSLRLGKRLRPGMVSSVEPGIYFIPELIGLWRSQKRFEAFIDYGSLAEWMPVGGMRNEEDWLVTDSGARRLGPAFDKSIAALEAARSSR